LRPRIQPLVWEHVTFLNYEEEEKDVKISSLRRKWSFSLSC
jgi:hypothetical protein